jgi:beta-mannosidase
MSRIARFVVLTASLFSVIPMLAAPPTRLELDRNWEFRQMPATATGESAWHPAIVPGDVHLDLLANALIPEPFSRDNEAKLQWISEASWQYRTHVAGTQDLLRRQHLELVFEGLDSEAEVSLNGHPILDARNSFREFRVDIRALLQPGENELVITFAPPDKTAVRLAGADRWRGKTPAADKSYLRKAAYEYGWDWGPTFVTSGIWRPAHLDGWDDLRIADLYVRQRQVTSTLARLDAEVTVVAATAGPASLRLDWRLPGAPRHILTRPVTLSAGENHLTFPVEIHDPALWFPNGYGEQPLYGFKATVLTHAIPRASREATTGLRSLVLRQEPDKFGRSFEFVVNGIPIFAKGADVIPFDSFPSRVDEAQYRHILQSARDANMNMVRHWGGGLYESETFYRIADELGIMVWQDFMFGNDWQPGTPSFRDEVRYEADYQVARLRNHPSIVLWCGNNETEESLGWGKNDLQKTLDTAGHVRIWQDYLLLFSSVLPDVVARLDPETPYWPSSPSANFDDQLALGQHSGDSHNWDVWHGRVPFSTYEKHRERFVSEYGFQSFPEARTIAAFTEPADRTGILTPVMLVHQKNDEGNSLIHDYMLRDYPEPRDFASFLYASQVLQAEGIKIGAEHLRRIRPENMGSLFWQLNDCWPVASWSSIDYYGRWKALQFYARRFYSPLLVSPHVEDDSLAVYVVSDKIQPQAATLTLRLMTFDGKVLREESKSLDVAPLSSSRSMLVPLATLLPASTDLTQVVVLAELRVSDAIVSSNVIYLVPTKEVHLPAASIAFELSPVPDGFRIHLSSPVLARAVHLELDLSAPSRPNLGDPDTFSDDFFDLVPGQPVDVVLHTRKPIEAIRPVLRVRSLADAFAATTASAR